MATSSAGAREPHPCRGEARRSTRNRTGTQGATLPSTIEEWTVRRCVPRGGLVCCRRARGPLAHRKRAYGAHSVAWTRFQDLGEVAHRLPIWALPNLEAGEQGERRKALARPHVYQETLPTWSRYCASMMSSGGSSSGSGSLSSMRRRRRSPSETRSASNWSKIDLSIIALRLPTAIRFG